MILVFALCTLIGVAMLFFLKRRPRWQRRKTIIPRAEFEMFMDELDILPDARKELYSSIGTIRDLKKVNERLKSCIRR